MSIWIAAAAILAVSSAAIAALFAKMALKELRDSRKRQVQLPLPQVGTTQEGDKHKLQPVG